MKGIFVEKIVPAIADKDWYYRRVFNRFADSELFSAFKIPSIKDLDLDLYTCSTMQAPEVKQSDSEVEQSEEQPEEAEEPEPVDLADSLL